MDDLPGSGAVATAGFRGLRRLGDLGQPIGTRNLGYAPPRLFPLGKFYHSWAATGNPRFKVDSEKRRVLFVAIRLFRSGTGCTRNDAARCCLVHPCYRIVFGVHGPVRKAYSGKTTLTTVNQRFQLRR